MRFTVVSLKSAVAQLAEIWNTAADRQAIADASDRIDALLANDPLTKVTPVDQYYYLTVEPLLVLCDISVDDRLVRIIEVHYKG
jgi:hypothetical protein